MRAKSWWTIARRLALVGVLLLVGHYVWRHLADLRQLDFSFTPAPLLLSITAALSWMLVQSYLWRLVLRAVGAATGARPAIAQVWLPNLGKYLPGKIWAAVGRIYLSGLAGIPLARATLGLAVENVCFILAGAMLAAITLLLSTGLSRSGADDHELLLPLLAVVVVGLVVVHPRVWSGVANLLLRRLGRETIEPHIGYRRSLGLVLCYVVSWSLLGIGLCAWTMAIAPFTPELALRVVGVYVIGWSLGYVSMLAPAGIGVREGIMMAGLAGQVAPEQAVAIALGLRVYFTLIDVVAALLAVAVAPDLARRLARSG